MNQLANLQTSSYAILDALGHSASMASSLGVVCWVQITINHRNP
jgi:hypothetical protein